MAVDLIPFAGDMGQIVVDYGTDYTSAADALKEIPSNAIDEWIRVGSSLGLTPCEVTFTITRKDITIEHNQPGISSEQWRKVASNIRRSEKKSDPSLIGEKAVGLWSGFYLARKITFYSRALDEDVTHMVIARRGDSGIQAPQKAKKRYWLNGPGMKIVLSDFDDPGLVWRSVTVKNLSRKLQKKYRKYLRRGFLKLVIIRKSGKRTHKEVVEVEPIDLPRLESVPMEQHVGGNPDMRIEFELYFHPGGKGEVSIDHREIPIIDGIQQLSHREEALGLGETILASGYVHGSIGANFLIPMPDRHNFVYSDESWLQFIASLDSLVKGIEAEVKAKQRKLKEKRRPDLYKQAVVKAQKILEALDLDPLTGYRKRKRRDQKPRPPGTDEPPEVETELKEKKKNGGSGPSDKKGNRSRNHLLVQEISFGSDERHSDLVEGVVRVNTDHIDYVWAMMQEDESEHVRYIGECVGKETILASDTDADEKLEMLLAFHYAWEQS